VGFTKILLFIESQAASPPELRGGGSFFDLRRKTTEAGSLFYREITKKQKNILQYACRLLFSLSVN
jgi:hypothetical protein